MNGRLKFRNALQGKYPGPPLLVPLVFGLAARTANVPLSDMASDPDKFSAAIGGFYGLLGSDVIVNSFDVTVEGEVLGCEVEWPGEFNPPVLLGGISASAEVEIEEFLGRGRIPAVLETTRRLSISLGREKGIA